MRDRDGDVVNIYLLLFQVVLHLPQRRRLKQVGGITRVKYMIEHGFVRYKEGS
jgi:hypothetical protein